MMRWLVVVSALALVRATLLVGDDSISSSIYTLDTAIDPPAISIIHRIVGTYRGGCSYTGTGSVYMLFGSAASSYRLDTLYVATNNVSSGKNFQLPNQVVDIKCDTVWHTVVLTTVTTDDVMMSVYSVTPLTGNAALITTYNSTSQYGIIMSYGENTYSSKVHKLYLSVFEYQKIGPKYFGTLYIVDMVAGYVKPVPWENDGFLFESSAVLSYDDQVLVGVDLAVLRFGSNLIRAGGNSKPRLPGASFNSTLDYWHYTEGTFADVGQSLEAPMTWAVGSVIDEVENHYYLLSNPSDLDAAVLTYDLTSGARSQSSAFTTASPWNWVGLL
eukprot:TRINITY_DN790_c0_g1_i1.p1 TRINITY_DN790_c0_g1~~TRINITY_DN790_c0_g1_i1.p1  ORF type:complete len:329 (-),score=52.17 TRINITY_DN790_c0_g1_i1:81-1067(-)